LSDDDDWSGDESDDENGKDVHIKGAVNPEDIMAIATRKRQSKAEKLEKVLAGRSTFEAKKREGGSTNIEKTRRKNFLMTKFSKLARKKGKGKGTAPKKRLLTGTHEAKKRRRKL
jgi:protein SDA1